MDWGSDEVVAGKDIIKKFINISGLNYYFVWYTPEIQNLDTALTEVHKNYPDAVIGLSEYGAGGNPAQHQLIRPGFK